MLGSPRRSPTAFPQMPFDKGVEFYFIFDISERKCHQALSLSLPLSPYVVAAFERSNNKRSEPVCSIARDLPRIGLRLRARARFRNRQTRIDRGVHHSANLAILGYGRRLLCGQRNQREGGGFFEFRVTVSFVELLPVLQSLVSDNTSHLTHTRARAENRTRTRVNRAERRGEEEKKKKKKLNGQLFRGEPPEVVREMRLEAPCDESFFRFQVVVTREPTTQDGESERETRGRAAHLSRRLCQQKRGKPLPGRSCLARPTRRTRRRRSRGRSVLSNSSRRTDRAELRSK